MRMTLRADSKMMTLQGPVAKGPPTYDLSPLSAYRPIAALNRNPLHDRVLHLASPWLRRLWPLAKVPHSRVGLRGMGELLCFNQAPASLLQFARVYVLVLFLGGTNQRCQRLVVA
jgi:hypothetical protein